MYRSLLIPILVLFILLKSDLPAQPLNKEAVLHLNEKDYYEVQGLNVMVFDDFYPEGHQGGITIVHHGIRVAANGDLRLEPSPGQWSPTPVLNGKQVDREKQVITAELSYPDSAKDGKGFNPIVYPDLKFGYKIKTEISGNSGIKIIISLEKPFTDEWNEKVGFNLELFPGHFFGEHYIIDNQTGIFPRQANGPTKTDPDGNLYNLPLGEGNRLVLCPADPHKKITIESSKNTLQLIDGRGLHNNGWFIVRSEIPSGKTGDVIEWIITAETDTSWRYKPVIQVSQIGYHPGQSKFAVIELDKLTNNLNPVQLIKITGDSMNIVKQESSPSIWGIFLRYKYIRFDFSNIKAEGIYKIRYGNIESHEFEIKKNIFARHVWHPVLEYFLPVQMCHMRIEDRYRVWHGLCHMDDALMAPLNHNHFDGYYQKESTFTKYNSGEHVPGLNIGGWHDAGDDDLRVESQAATVYKLGLAYEFFRNDYDENSVDQEKRLVEIHKPDGKPDILQQIEHGVLAITGGYESMGRLYRGIISPRLKQYVHLGDTQTMSDNLIYDRQKIDPVMQKPLPEDDRWVFTEQNSRRELYTAQVLASAARVLKEYNPGLADKCLRIAEEIFHSDSSKNWRSRINTAAELYLTTSGDEYEKLITDYADSISRNIESFSEVIGRIEKKIKDEEFSRKIRQGVADVYNKISGQQKENPYGVPYKPYIWGAGWGIQASGVSQLFLHLGFPEIFSAEFAYNAMNFVLGCHPGENTASFASGVGANSLITAYGFNRDDWSYIPGGVASGTSLIRPDLPELKLWPYFWQQTEYIIGGGSLDFMLLVMSADYLLNRN